MSMSLREQLLAAGLGTKKQARQAEHEQRQEKRQQQRTGKTPSPDIASLIGYIAPAALPSAGLPLAPGSGVQVGAHPMTTQELLGTSGAISPALLLGGAALVALAMRKR